MLAVILISVAFILVALTVLCLVADGHRARRIGVRCRVVVNLVDDRAMTGILWRRRRNLVQLRSAELVEPGRSAVAMDGEVVIERDRINWVQIVGS